MLIYGINIFGRGKLIYCDSLIFESECPSLAVMQINLSSDSYFYTN